MLKKTLLNGPQDKPQQIKINLKRQRAKGYLYVMHFKDQDQEIAYMPALNLTGYGDSRQEAFELLHLVMDDFFNGLFNLSSERIIAELKKLGFVQNTFFKNDFSKDAHVDTEGVLRNFNLPVETEIESQLVTV